VFRLDEQRISSLITPRTEMVWLDLNDTKEANIAKMTQDRYSSYPVGRGNVDNIVGIAQAKDLLSNWMKTGELDIESAMTPPVFVPETATVAGAIRMFKKEGIHTLLILSEYGGVEGLVRMHDVIEQIFGNLEEDETPHVRQEENPPSQTLDGQYPLNKFMEQYPDFELPEDESGKYETVAGFIMARLRKVPEVGDTFDYEGMHFNVLTMDGVRIDSIQVDILESTKETQNEQS
jgi:putative hemolysin